MSRLKVGMIIKTNYNTGPYEIVHILRGCTCSAYLDVINMGDDEAPPGEPHIHITCKSTDPEKRGFFYLNRFNEETLCSIRRFDHGPGCRGISTDKIEIVEEPKQATMPFMEE